MAIVIFILFVTISKIFIVEMCMTLTLTFRMSQIQCNVPVKSPCMTLHSMSIVTCTISVIVCEIITRKLSKYYRIQYLTLKWKIKVIRNNVADYILDAKLIHLKLFGKWQFYRKRFVQLHILSAPRVKDRKIFNFWPWKCQWRSQVWNIEITKANNGCQTERNESLCASIWRPVWPIELAEIEQKQIQKQDTIYILSGINCAASRNSTSDRLSLIRRSAVTLCHTFVRVNQLWYQILRLCRECC